MSIIVVPLMGEHQAKNCALAMALCKEVLKELDMVAVKKKLIEIDWPGRMEVISKDPFVMLDACINAASVVNVRNVLEHLAMGKVTTIVGIPDDKDFLGVIKGMKDVSENIILTKSQNPHYNFTEKQGEKALEIGIESMWTNSVEEAIRKAEEKELPIVILGTTSVVSEVKNLYINL